MVFDRHNRRSVAAELDANIGAIRDHLRDDDDLLDRYRRVLTALPERWTSAGICDRLESVAHPGALPSNTFDEVDSLVQDHPDSEQWASHEAVNDWARASCGTSQW